MKLKKKMNTYVSKISSWEIPSGTVGGIPEETPWRTHEETQKEIPGKCLEEFLKVLLEKFLQKQLKEKPEATPRGIS